MDLPQDHVRALDQLRTRLSQLATSLNLMLSHLETSNPEPLPTWPTLQADATTVGANLAELADVLNAQRQLFSAMHAYPLPNFPGTTQAHILEGLLRKKLDPRAEAWIDESLKKNPQIEDSSANLLSDEQMKEIWNSAKPSSREIIGPMLEDGVFEEDYTIEELEQGTESIVTGVRHLDRGEGDDKMDEDKPAQALVVGGSDMAQPAEPLENILRFATTGELRPHGPNR